MKIKTAKAAILAQSKEPLVVDQIWKEPEAASFLSENGVDCKSVAIFPYLEPDGKKGALYLVNPSSVGGDPANVLLIQPFLNLIPVSYLHFSTQLAAT